jgi:hypothetical protein
MTKTLVITLALVILAVAHVGQTPASDLEGKLLETGVFHGDEGLRNQVSDGLACMSQPILQHFSVTS